MTMNSIRYNPKFQWKYLELWLSIPNISKIISSNITHDKENVVANIN